MVRDANKVWHKDEHKVVRVVDHFECVLRNDEGDTCAVVLAHNILAITPPEPVMKPKKRPNSPSPGRRGRPAANVRPPRKHGGPTVNGVDVCADTTATEASTG